MFARLLSRVVLPLVVAGLAACGRPMPQAELSGVRFAEVIRPQGIARSNRDLAEDFVELTLALESGQRLAALLRYEQPVRVYLRSPGLAAYRRDLSALLARLRAEAGLDIAETSDPDQAQIVIEAVPAAQIERIYPTAACFIVPGETSWRSFLDRPESEHMRWSDQTTLERAAIFLPLDTTPQDVRDCLNEEITQALGPANDLYRLPDSIWNDDNFHGMATPFDMLILRTLYQPEFHSGMTRAAVVSAVLPVLDRVNPAGRSLPRQARHPESRAWGGAIEAALARSAPRGARLGAARVATAIAAEMRPLDHRLDVSELTLGRLTLRRDPVAAAKLFAEAYNRSRAELGLQDIRTSQAGVHVAALALAAGQYDIAVTLADANVPAARAGQNAILMAGYLSIKAEALAGLGQLELAQAARLDSLRWARYGFGDTDGALAREQADLAAMMRLEDG